MTAATWQDLKDPGQCGHGQDVWQEHHISKQVGEKCVANPTQQNMFQRTHPEEKASKERQVQVFNGSSDLNIQCLGYV